MGIAHVTPMQGGELSASLYRMQSSMHASREDVFVGDPTSSDKSYAS